MILFAIGILTGVFMTTIILAFCADAANADKWSER